MSLKWPNKDPDARLDYSLDWSRFLGSDTISSVTWFVDDSDGTKTSFTPGSTVNTLTNYTESNTSTVATIWLADGTANTTYKITCQITTSASLINEKSVRITVKET